MSNSYTLADLRARRNEILTLTQKHGVSNVRVFGSVARNTSSTESDVDLLVTAQDGVDVFDLVGLWMELKDLLGCEVSLVTDGIEDKRFLDRIKSDLVTL